MVKNYINSLYAKNKVMEVKKVIESIKGITKDYFGHIVIYIDGSGHFLDRNDEIIIRFDSIEDLEEIIKNK